MSSKVLNFETPLNTFQSFISSTLPLKIFGCTAFVHINDHNRGKLEPQAQKGMFVGYAYNKKG